jgi:hypothetical protein
METEEVYDSEVFEAVKTADGILIRPIKKKKSGDKDENLN